MVIGVSKGNEEDSKSMTGAQALPVPEIILLIPHDWLALENQMPEKVCQSYLKGNLPG